MRYADFNGIELSRLGMGNMRLPVRGITRSIDAAKARAIIDYCMESGVNYYDTALFYHHGASEPFLGKALSRHPRDSYYLADKYLFVRPDYKRVFEGQLKKLKTDRIDFYLVHSLMDVNVGAYEGNGCIDYFLEQQRQGRIGYLGFSSHASTKVLKRFLEHHQWDFCQLQLNYYDWEYGTAREQYELACDHDTPVMVMEPLRGGKLASLSSEADAVLKAVSPRASVASWGMRWLMGLDNVKVVLSGMGDLAQVKDNVETFSYAAPLDERERSALATALALYRKEVAVPCTACRYCTDDCPRKIDIPEVLSVYNQWKAHGDVDAGKLPQPGPDACISCGACTRICPQGIDIPQCMVELAQAQ